LRNFTQFFFKNPQNDQKKLKTLKLQNNKTSKFQNSQEQNTPSLHMKKENEDPQNDKKKKLKTLKLKKNKKSPKVHKMNCFFEKKYHNKNQRAKTITRKTKQKAKMKFKHPIPPLKKK
jgi:hypothetical protein